MKKISIRFKITLIAVLAILTAIICIFAASYPSIQSESDRRSVEIMNLIGEDTKNKLDEYLAGIEESVSLVANLAIDSLDSVALVEYGAAGSYAALNGRTQEQTDQLDRYISDHCDRIRESIESVAIHTNGAVAYYYCINPEISETENGFFYSRVGKAGFVEQEPLKASDLDPEDTEHNSWYYDPVKHGIPCWVGPFDWNYPQEIEVCSYVTPIYSTGVLIGVLGMDIPMEILIDQVSPIRVYQTGFASLYDKEGHILYHPEEKRGTAPELSDLSVSEELLSQENSGDAMIRYTVNDETRQMAFFTLRNGMKLFLSAPVKEINASGRAIVRNIIIITALIILCAAIAVMLIMRFITLPLENLTSASAKLADGDYDVTLNYRGKDEIGTLTAAFSKMRDELKRNMENLNTRAYTDVLTGLPNMRHFFTLAKAGHKQLIEAGKEPVMLFFDMVGMKHYNRQYGFEEGDRLLCEVGEILVQEFGRDCLCRYSDDHFAVVTDEESMKERLERIFAQCEKVNGGNSLPVHVGVYQSKLEDVSVSVACDRAKYACEKHRGSYVSGYYYFDIDMIRELAQVQYIINHLDQAIREHWVKVYYQPIIDAESGTLCEEEALSRWIDPIRGVLSPADFIPILEKARLIYRLDLHVVDEVLKKMKTQQELGIKIVPHSINLSRTDFVSCDIVEEIRCRVDEAGIGRGMITIELTESILGSDFLFMKEQINRFHQLGFQVWMDDFGSGYSSLDVLHEIHFDLIKFDMRFLQHFDQGEDSRIILMNLLHMTRELGIASLCEGVETEKQVEFLRRYQCDRMQGFYFSKPVPYETILKRIDQDEHIGYEFHEG